MQVVVYVQALLVGPQEERGCLDLRTLVDLAEEADAGLDGVEGPVRFPVATVESEVVQEGVGGIAERNPVVALVQVPVVVNPRGRNDRVPDPERLG